MKFELVLVMLVMAVAITMATVDLNYIVNTFYLDTQCQIPGGIAITYTNGPTTQPCDSSCTTSGTTSMNCEMITYAPDPASLPTGYCLTTFQSVSGTTEIIMATLQWYANQCTQYDDGTIAYSMCTPTTGIVYTTTGSSCAQLNQSPPPMNPLECTADRCEQCIQSSATQLGVFAISLIYIYIAHRYFC